MPSKTDPLRVLDHLVTPDLWPDIRQRQPSISPEPPTSTRRLVTALVALAAAVAGSVVVIVAFSGERADRPLSQSSTERIVFSGGGGDAQVLEPSTSVWSPSQVPTSSSPMTQRRSTRPPIQSGWVRSTSPG